MMKCIRLFLIYFKLHIKSMIIYRGDFFFSLFSDVVWSVAGLLIMQGIFGNGSSIGSYTYNEVAFMYAYSLTSLGIYYVFFRNVANISEKYIYEGNLDRLIVRPINTFFQIVLEKFSIDKGGDLVVGIILLVVYGNKISVLWDVKTLFVLIILLLCSSLIYLEINSIYAVSSFWLEDRYGLSGCLDSFRIFVKYPIDIYNQALRFILTFFLPYAFTAFYPAMVFLKGRSEYIALTVLMTIIFAMILYVLWKKGIRRYSSIGN